MSPRVGSVGPWPCKKSHAGGSSVSRSGEAADCLPRRAELQKGVRSACFNPERCPRSLGTTLPVHRPLLRSHTRGVTKMPVMPRASGDLRGAPRGVLVGRVTQTVKVVTAVP